MHIDEECIMCYRSMKEHVQLSADATEGTQYEENTLLIVAEHMTEDGLYDDVGQPCFMGS